MRYAFLLTLPSDITVHFSGNFKDNVITIDGSGVAQTSYLRSCGAQPGLIVIIRLRLYPTGCRVASAPHAAVSQSHERVFLLKWLFTMRIIVPLYQAGPVEYFH